MIGIVMGSTSDWETMKAAARTLEEFGVRYEAKAMSAHRTPAAVAEWASREVAGMGQVSRKEIIVAVLACVALVLWIFGASFINPTTVALVMVVLMLSAGVFTWDDMLKCTAAWNAFVLLATLVALADGLGRTGFVTWFGQSLSGYLSDVSAGVAIVALIAVYFVTHYMFASATAHVTALLPVMLTAGAAIPSIPMRPFALLLCLTLGLMCVITPYGTAPNLIYYGSGYLPTRDFWRLGTIFGAIYLTVFLAVCVPWVLYTS
jgi:L-tartrate/succinate antiporter